MILSFQHLYSFHTGKVQKIRVLSDILPFIFFGKMFVEHVPIQNIFYALKIVGHNRN